MHYKRFEVLTAVNVFIAVLWVLTPCGLVGDPNVSDKRITAIFTSP
jgi:hypothetical protein